MFPDLIRDDVFRLETKRLWLRWPRAADANEIAHLAGDTQIAGATARIPHPYTAETAIAFVLQARRENSEGEAAIFVLAAKHRPTVPLGVISLEEAGERRLVLGYWLGRPYWKRGLMAEAAHAMLELAFTWTDAAEIVAAAQVANFASRRVLEKCGFRFVRQALEAAPARPGPILCAHYGLRRDNWLARETGALEASPATA